MKKTTAPLLFVCCVVLVHATLAQAQGPGATSNTARWPTHGWAKGAPASVGLDEKVLAAMDSDLETGKYPQMDSFAVFRCGLDVFERTYSHDYGTIYGKEANTRGPLNAHLKGWYNYFDPEWHPYFHGTDLHSMQSVTKTVSSIIVGIAITRGDFKADLDTPLLKYFDLAKVKNVDERKRRITLRHVLTMSTGLDWKEDGVPYDDPKNDCSVMEASEDWVQYAIDKPMALQPGKIFNYNSGVAALVAYVFQKETGQDIEKYGEKYLFQPLGMDHFWKRTPLGLPDTEGGAFLSTTDLAKLGYLYLHDGMWDGKQIVSKDWVKQSVAPFIDVEKGWKYGFLWWLFQPEGTQEFDWAALGFGGQRLMVFPQEELIVVFTGWRALNDNVETLDLAGRILPAVSSQSCNVPH
jgi:CubicO group peptidase (beta-lactamase class C family)